MKKLCNRLGSHAVVTTSFPDYSMIAGVPTKLIKKIFKLIIGGKLTK